jgi:hypothetical protein
MHDCSQYHNQAEPQCGQWCEDGHDVTQQRQYQSGGPQYFRDSDEADQGTGQAFDPCLPARDQLLFGPSGFHHARKKKQGGQQALGYPQHRIHGLAPSGTSSYPQLTISPEHFPRMIIYFAPSKNSRIAFVSAWNICDSTILPSRIL